MSFFKRKFEAPQPSENEATASRLEALKKRKENLEAYAGSDGWGAADRTLLAQLEDEISRLEGELGELKEAA